MGEMILQEKKNELEVMNRRGPRNVSRKHPGLRIRVVGVETEGRPGCEGCSKAGISWLRGWAWGESSGKVLAFTPEWPHKEVC